MRLLFIHLSCILLMACGTSDRKTSHNQPEKPNILWITCEDITTMVGCYGDPVAVTPNIDALASKGILYKNAYSTAPVCSPARSCLVTGVYATSLGTQNLRSDFQIPSIIRTLPHILRDNGYYCSNNYKEDYNFFDSTIWDESSHEAHWRNRPDNKPFFSVFNFETTHQSQIFGDDESFYNKYGHQLAEEERTKPEQIKLQPYYFDSHRVRKLWARYYDLVKIMDRQVGEILNQLEEDGLQENTIVFFYSDHGTGMPRAKRALYNSGVKVPFVVFIPERYRYITKYEPGTLTDEMVSFVDFPPTLLNILDIKIPDYMTGNLFLGKQTRQREYVYATSDRVDEAFEISRTVKDKKFSYIRNFLPHLPLIQPNFYTDQSEIMQELLKLRNSVEMTPAQKSMWLPRREPEELYDLENDPFETNNLAKDPTYSGVLLKMRYEMTDWMKRTFDTGLVPEGYLWEHCKDLTAYELARSAQFLNMEEIIETNDALLKENTAFEELTQKLSEQDVLIRYWAAKSLQYLDAAPEETIEILIQSLDDPSIYVQLAAAETLCSWDQCSEIVQNTILKGLKSEDKIVSLMAARIFELNKNRAILIKPMVKAEHAKLCSETAGKWQGYDLYACWALTEAFK